MATVKTLLDRAQRHLADAQTIGEDGVIWTRAELLAWLRDGYRTFLARTEAAKRFVVLPVPPRHSFSITYPWEQRHVQGGTLRHWTFTSFDGRRQTTTLWELESREGLTPQTHHTCITYLWELAHISQDIDQHYRFALPRHHQNVYTVWHDHERLEALTTRELDRLDSAWYRESGEPLWWTPGLGDNRTFEVYEVETEYVQSYQQTSLFGIARHFSGDRTYSVHEESSKLTTWRFAYTNSGEVADGFSGTGLRITRQATEDGFTGTQIWEREMQQGLTTFSTGQIVGTFPWESTHGAANVGGLPVGVVRRVTSPDRQYIPQDNWRDPLGTIRSWHSSDQNLLVWESVSPDVPDLQDTTESVPDMIPAQLHKYLLYYVWSWAFNRQGEGYNPNLALHWQQRFNRAVPLMQRLDNVAWRDVHYQRETQRQTRKKILPQPQLPPEFPAVPWLR